MKYLICILFLFTIMGCKQEKQSDKPLYNQVGMDKGFLMRRSEEPTKEKIVLKKEDIDYFIKTDPLN